MELGVGDAMAEGKDGHEGLLVLELGQLEKDLDVEGINLIELLTHKG